MKRLRGFILIIIILAVGYITLSYPGRSDKYDINGDLIAQISSTVPNYTSLDRIPDDLKDAVLAVEDRRFNEHPGIDIRGIARALVTNIREGEIKEGGSTLTQQLVKNLFLEPDRSLGRKLNELILTLKIERKYSKDDILEMYLNVIYYGSGAYGIQNASREYFNKDVWELSLGECAMLAGLPQAPSAYNPKKHYDRAKKRQEDVLSAMSQTGYDGKKIEGVLDKAVPIAN